MRLPIKLRYPRAAAFAAGAFVLYLLLGFLVAPAVIGHFIPKFVADKLQRKVTVGAVRVNPLLLSMEIRDLALTESSGAPIAGFKRLLVDFQLSSLPRWAWTFSEVTLEGLDVRADIAPDGRFNLAALLEDLTKDRHSDGAPPRLLLQQVMLRNGVASFSDRSDPTPASTTVGPVSFELNDISTIPDHHGSYAVNARLMDGGTIAWRGEVSLQPLSSKGEIAVNGVRPLTAWRFLRDELGVDEPRGAIDVVARYRVAYARGVPEAAIEGLRIAGRDIELSPTGAKAPILALAGFEIEGGRFDLASRELVVPHITVHDGTIGVDVDADGRINWQKLVKQSPDDSDSKPGTTSSGKPWKARVESVQVKGVGIDYTDRSRARPVRFAVKNLNASLAAAIASGPDRAQVLLEKIALALEHVSAGEAANAEPLVSLDSIGISGGSLDLREKRLDVGKLTVAGGGIRVIREKGGGIPLIDLFSTQNVGLLRREVSGAFDQAKAQGSPWRVAVNEGEAAGTHITFADRSFGDTVTYDVQDLRARINDFRSDGKQPLRFDAAVRLAQGGALSAAGTYRLKDNQVDVRAKVDRLNLKPLQPALASRARVVLSSATVSGDQRIQYRQQKGRAVVRASGPITVDNLLVNDAVSGESLLGWKSLGTDSVRLSLDPDELRIGEVRISGLTSKMVVFQDRSFNLAKVFIPETGSTEAAPVAAGDTEPPFLVSIGRVGLDNGHVDFTDLSLALPFAAVVRELDGVIQNVSTDHDSRASVRVNGRVDEYGLARVEGSLRPFRPKSFLDLAVTFRNVEMPTLSPYTVTFAGRRIASGRLSLDLIYKIEDSKLSGDNRVVLEKFVLGERVETPGALSLPLDLAVAVLTDSQGRIDLAIPVSGNVDDPQFSYGHVIWQAIVNVLTRIITSPFRALGALFGAGGGESLENIAFEPGRAVLLPPEREKLKRVAEGIAKRPQLKLVAEGQFGKADREALRQRDVENAVSTRLRRPTAADATTEPVNVTEARTQRALEAIFIERNSEQALDEFATGVGKTRGKPVDRVNAVLALAGRGSADSPFYEALLKRLIETARVPDDALRQLADARARAVAEYFVITLSMPADRVAARVAAEPGEARVRFAFDVVTAGPSASPDPGSPASPR
ncbi:MAG TPA: DUF748 domain-containing protein [Burkholderiales bacterium]|nr:DUF748 domain-containing protein [Burkholderiales bacterium]